MVDDVDLSELNVIDSAEEVLRQPGHEVTQEICESLIAWIDKNYRKQMKDLIVRQGRGRNVAMANLSRDLARALYIISRSPQSQNYEQRLFNLLLNDRNTQSIVNCASSRYQLEVKNQIIGTLSILTFLDIMKRLEPGSVSGMKISEIIAEGREDVDYSVDLKIVRRASDGTLYIDLIQLKSDTLGLARIILIDEEKDYFGKVTRQSSRRIISAVNKYKRENQGAEVRAFAVLVPAYECPSVNNIFGRIQVNEEQERESLEAFREEAGDWGFIPVGKATYWQRYA